MAEFSIRFSNVENSIEVLSHYAVQLNEIKQEVASAKRNLQGMGSATYRVYSVLSYIERSVVDEALAMRSLSGALEKISNYYRNAENSILSNSPNAATTEMSDAESGGSANIVQSLWKKIREILVAWGIIKAGNQTRIPGEAVTEAQQKEMDQHMRNKVQKLLEEERYSEETWNEASLEERKDILNQYLQEVAAAMGLEIGPINFTYSEASNGTYNMGAYSPSTNTVNINEWVLEDNVDNSYRLMSTIAHEMRHAYQHAACENPEQFVVTEETLRSWQDSIDNYKSQSGFMKEGMNAQEAYEAYRDQSIEVDARWFAGQD